MERPLRPRAHIIIGILICAGALGSARAQESPGYVADRTTLAGAAGRASSPGYVLEATAAEIHPVGSGSFCNVGFTGSTGFWSVLGDAQVPIILQVRHDPADPAVAELRWTGSAPQFDLLRSPDALDARDPLNLLTATAGCDSIDPDPPTPDVFYYVVIPADGLEARR